MRAPTVVISLAVHVGLAAFLLSRAEHNKARKAISVAVTSPEKKAAPKPPPPPPPPPPKPKAEAKVEAPEPETNEAPTPSAPAETGLSLSNADLAPGGIALAGTPKLKTDEGQAKPATPDTSVKRVVAKADTAQGAAEAPCDEEATKPEVVFKTEIEYSAAARAEGVEGRLVLTLTIGKDGSVTDVSVDSSVEAALDAAAVAAVKQWRFKPAMKCGKPVAGGTYKLARRFELAD